MDAECGDWKSKYERKMREYEEQITNLTEK